ERADAERDAVRGALVAAGEPPELPEFRDHRPRARIEEGPGEDGVGPQRDVLRAGRHARRGAAGARGPRRREWSRRPLRPHDLSRAVVLVAAGDVSANLLLR